MEELIRRPRQAPLLSARPQGDGRGAPYPLMAMGAMKKRTGRTRPLDWRLQAKAGLRPWTPDGLLEAFARWQELIDSSAHHARISARGRITLRLPTARMGRYFVDRYGPREGTTHFVRWAKIGEFLADDMERLSAAGLVRVGPGGTVDMNADLVASLCTVRYRRFRAGRRTVYAIAWADVMRKVRRRARGEPGPPADRNARRGRHV